MKSKQINYTVAETVHNWGFSNETYASPGHELSRMACLLEKMDALKAPSTCTEPKKRSDRCNFPGQLIKCKAHGKDSSPPFLLNYTSAHAYIPIGNKKTYLTENARGTPGRTFVYQGSDKWYKFGPPCCPQPSCPAPQCPGTVQICCNHQS